LSSLALQPGFLDSVLGAMEARSAGVELCLDSSVILDPAWVATYLVDNLIHVFATHQLPLKFIEVISLLVVPGSELDRHVEIPPSRKGAPQSGDELASGKDGTFSLHQLLGGQERHGLYVWRRIDQLPEGPVRGFLAPGLVLYIVEEGQEPLLGKLAEGSPSMRGQFLEVELAKEVKWSLRRARPLRALGDKGQSSIAAPS
jgi:hypothetical protein